MTSKLKCPFCQQELKCWDEPHNAIYSNWSCPNCRRFAYGNKLIWQELIRTRNALDIAVDVLTRITVSPETMMEPEKVVPQLADLALKQITALEQKDVK